MPYAPPAATVEPACPWCAAAIDEAAKFCGQCGRPAKVSFGRHAPPRAQPRQHHGVPTFALPPRPVPYPESANIPQELARCEILLWRERIFLVIHWLVYISLNLGGLALAVQCYSGFIGDVLTKLCMAGTPLMFINTSALLCFLPIKGARREIFRLKNRLAYLRFKHEYDHLLV
ncbi:MAG TPA: hypothetical protein V6D08_19300 [Candidatus Obscuribacterales bacterium]